jgi:hypothetical protein
MRLPTTCRPCAERPIPVRQRSRRSSSTADTKMRHFPLDNRRTLQYINLSPAFSSPSQEVLIGIRPLRAATRSLSMKPLIIAVLALAAVGLTQTGQRTSVSTDRSDRHYFTKGSVVAPIEHTQQDDVFRMIEANASTQHGDLITPTFVFQNISETPVIAGAFLLRLYLGDRILHEVQQSFDSNLLPDSQPVQPSGTVTADFNSITDKLHDGITRVEVATDYIELADGRILGPNVKRIDRQIAATRQGARAMLNYLKQKYAEGGSQAVERVLNPK